MADREYRPYVPLTTSLPEFTARAVILGLVLTIILGAANAYLGLRAGMTIAATYPAAVISMAVLRLMRGSILEENMARTVGSIGESVAAGAIFTIPAFVIAGVWMDFSSPEAYFESTARHQPRLPGRRLHHRTHARLLNFAGGLLAWGLMVPLLIYFLGPELQSHAAARRGEANGADSPGRVVSHRAPHRCGRHAGGRQPTRCSACARAWAPASRAPCDLKKAGASRSHRPHERDLSPKIVFPGLAPRFCA
jgi:hypothetical protein